MSTDYGPPEYPDLRALDDWCQAREIVCPGIDELEGLAPDMPPEVRADVEVWARFIRRHDEWAATAPMSLEGASNAVRMFGGELVSLRGAESETLQCESDGELMLYTLCLRRLMTDAMSAGVDEPLLRSFAGAFYERQRVLRSLNEPLRQAAEVILRATAEADE